MFHLGSISPSQVECNYLCLVVTCYACVSIKSPPGRFKQFMKCLLFVIKINSGSGIGIWFLAGFIEGFWVLLSLLTYLMLIPAFAKEGCSLVGKTALMSKQFLVLFSSSVMSIHWSKLSVRWVLCFSWGRVIFCFGQFLKAVSSWSGRTVLTKAAAVRSLWLIHLEETL